MADEVASNNDIVISQRRQLHPFELELKLVAVDQPANQPRRVDPVAAKQRDESHGVPDP